MTRLTRTKGDLAAPYYNKTYMASVGLPENDWEVRDFVLESRLVRLASLIETVFVLLAHTQLVEIALQMPPTSAPERPGDRSEAAGRNRFIMMARLTLRSQDDFEFAIPAEFASTAAWSEMAMYLAMAGAVYHTKQDMDATTGEREFYTVFNAYARALLVFCVVWHQAQPPGHTVPLERSEWFPLLQLARERVEKELQAINMSDELKAMVLNANTQRWSAFAHIATPRPALHP